MNHFHTHGGQKIAIQFLMSVKRLDSGEAWPSSPIPHAQESEMILISSVSGKHVKGCHHFLKFHANFSLIMKGRNVFQKHYFCRGGRGNK